MKNVRQVERDYYRRWFSDDAFELYVWYKSSGGFFGFQLCYDIAEKAKALTWVEDRGFSFQLNTLKNRKPNRSTRANAIFSFREILPA